MIDSRFVAIGDDGFIVKTFSGRCTAQHVGGRKITLTGMNVPLPGDVLRVWNPSNISSGLPELTVRVKSAEGSWASLNVTLTSPLPASIVCRNEYSGDGGDGGGDGGDVSIGGVTIDGSRGSGVGGGGGRGSNSALGLQWVNDNQTSPGFKFAKNTMQSRRFGVLLMGKDGIIEGNHFIDNPGWSIYLHHPTTLTAPHSSCTTTL